MTLSKNCLRKNIFLDVRDRSWFVDRVNLDENRVQAAQELYDRTIASALDLAALKAPVTLGGAESGTLLLFLELQRSDEAQEKGLTKSCFEALARAALRDTSSSNRITKEEIFRRVNGLMPRHASEKIGPHVDSALRRLSKSVIKHNTKTNDYHLAYQELLRLEDRAASIQSLRADYEADVNDVITTDTRINEADRDIVRHYIVRIVELFLHSRGEQFAAAVAIGTSILETDLELKDIIAQNLPPPLKGMDSARAVAVCLSATINLLRTPGTQTIQYLKLLSDCYTLFAFLAETPDVQRLTKRLFSAGEIWLDTNILLPVFAEQADNSVDAVMRPFTSLLIQLREMDIKVKVTRGVVEEVERHLNRCLIYARTSDWHGDVPFVMARYLLAGHSRSGFAAFAERFCGEIRAEDDIRDFLLDEFGIGVEEPAANTKIPDDSAFQITAYWQTVHERRRPLDIPMAMRLAKHDSENYLNVLNRRNSSGADAWLGYTAWWLTIDSAARQLLYSVDRDARKAIDSQPIMSLDFLTHYFSFGPLRSRVDRSLANPLDIFAAEIVENVPMSLIDLAQHVRIANANLSERLKIRRIRNEIDRQRMAYGSVHHSSMEQVGDAMRKHLT